MNETNAGSQSGADQSGADYSGADYTVQAWRVAPDASRTIDVTDVRIVHVGLMGGQVSVVGHDGDDTRIEIDGVVHENVDISLDDGVLNVNQPKLQFSRAFDSLKSVFGSSTKANVHVLTPRGTKVKVGTKTAEVLVSDLTAGATVNSATGEIQVNGVTGRLDINTASGRVDVFDLDGRLEVRTVSGEVTVMGRSEEIGVDTVSGDVLLDLTGHTRSISINSVSGDVTARLDAGLGVTARQRSVSGWMRIFDGQTIKGSQTVETEGESMVRISSSSVSGDLTVMHR